MKQTWRWFGPPDKVSVNDMLQAGVEGVVTALHHIPNGDVWTVDEIKRRQDLLVASPPAIRLTWDVVESLPVSEEIKQQSGDWRTHIQNYKQSMRNLAACGLKVICYNFMPVLDWTRTDLSHTLPNGAKCMRFDIVDFAAFDIHILGRSGAKNDFTPLVAEEATKRFSAMDDAHQRKLAENIVCGLPGAEQGYTLENLKDQLTRYDTIPDFVLRRHQIDFLAEVLPLAEQLGIRMCCHPDDPPFPLLGLPRIMSTEEDFRLLTQTLDSPANGITLCAGSLGVRPDNDLTGMMERLGDKVHFIHLRNVTRECDGIEASFHEAAHLEGATDMVALVNAVLVEEARRKESGRADHSIPFRPDHGQDILSDLETRSQPGYPAVGRLKGLAELRGIITTLSHPSMRATKH